MQIEYARLTDDVVARNIEFISSLPENAKERHQLILKLLDELTTDAPTAPNISRSDLKAIQDAFDLQEMAHDIRAPL